jgi:hypothetical protein
MWIAKGIFLGAAMFAVGAIVYLVFAVRAEMAGSEARAIGLTVIQALTIQNPYFWVALVACIVLGVSIVRSWPNNVPVV